MQFGRMAIKLQPNDQARPIIVKVASNGDGVVVDNLTCYNAIGGDKPCSLLLDRPNYCHLFVYTKSKVPDREHFDLDCPADLKLGY